jgi:hypothetical protein
VLPVSSNSNPLGPNLKAYPKPDFIGSEMCVCDDNIPTTHITVAVEGISWTDYIPCLSCIRLRIAPVLVSLGPESQTVQRHRSTTLPNSTCHSHPLWPLMATLPPLSPAPPQVHRADSQGSNISAGSMIASLSRRPRTKSRPRAVTVSSRRDRS